jgi:hypothetical protein
MNAWRYRRDPRPALKETLPARSAASILLVAAALLASTEACSSSSSSPSGPTGPVVTQTGTTVSYTPCSSPTPVAGAIISIGAYTATTSADGSYSIDVPQGEPFTMTVTATGYIPLTEAEDTVDATYDRGDTLLIAMDTAMFLEDALPGYSPKGSLLTIELVKTGSCTDVTGTTVSVSSPGTGAVTQYPAQCASPVGGSSATDGMFPVASDAVVYNLPAGMHTVTATSPKCTQVPYPYTDPSTGLTYDGPVMTQVGGGNSFTRVFLK